MTGACSETCPMAAEVRIAVFKLRVLLTAIRQQNQLFNFLQVIASKCNATFFLSSLNAVYLLIVGVEGYCCTWSHSMTHTKSVGLLWTGRTDRKWCSFKRFVYIPVGLSARRMNMHCSEAVDTVLCSVSLWLVPQLTHCRQYLLYMSLEWQLRETSAATHVCVKCSAICKTILLHTVCARGKGESSVWIPKQRLSILNDDRHDLNLDIKRKC
jgi:hypothetical protein